MDVKSPMARIIRGGKGSGRTHIMRYFSSQVQSLRGSHGPLQQMLQDGVVGIYVVCSGLNASRFNGRGQSDDTWKAIFPYYADLWLAQAALRAFSKVAEVNPPSLDAQRRINDEIGSSLIGSNIGTGKTLSELANSLFQMQSEVDRAVNNASLNPIEPLNLTINSSPGTLVFGIPTALRRHYTPFQDIRFLYLIDEFENFDVAQQQYVHTLVREKVNGVSFMIGVRTYGLRTLSTLSAGEENRHGSEFEEIRPDLNYAIDDRKKYADFCVQVVGRRLARCGLLEETSTEHIRDMLDNFFEVPDRFFEERLVLEQPKGRERRYIRLLNRQLDDLVKASNMSALSPQDSDLIIQAIQVPSRPLLEKVNALIIYRAWADGSDLVEKAKEIIDERLPPDDSGIVPPNETQQKILEHYATDLKDQLLRDFRRPPIYAGVKDFIEMSDGLPRNLLVLLKNVYRWSMFKGEDPFRGGTISLVSQRMGVLEASNWFLSDAKPLGEEGVYVIDAIYRLGEMFRKLRFTDKPVECSAASFSARPYKLFPSNSRNCENRRGAVLTRSRGKRTQTEEHRVDQA